MATVGVYDLPSGGAFGYTPTDDPQAESDTHELITSGDGPIVNSVVAGTNVTVDSTDPANPIVSASGGGGGLLKATEHLTGAQIATLFSAPVQVVPAPAAGKMIVPVFAVVQMVPATVAYAFVAGDGIGWAGFPFVGTLQSPLWDPDDSVFNLTLVPKTMIFGMGGGVANQAENRVTGTTTDVSGVGLVYLAATIDPPVRGPIVSADPTPAAAGTGYVANDTGTIDDIFGMGNALATYRVLTVNGGGGVLTYSITSGGANYSTAGNPWTTTVGGGQPGVGTGFTINVTTISPPDGDLYVTVYYTIETLH